ncbi:MAG: DnaD domain protein [Chloroflexi bacterium]|nr:DnaD domain protein [Ktedonobacteraceae bacterium]MBV9022061.1 DnaD domain protein [Ktedonobacteraceae bacterium]MBV9707372.1 DnaD domain protein [Chloroflexota bacterium]
MRAFTGFPSGKNPYVPIPEVFFTQVLPEIEDSAELKVTLHLFWLLAQKQGNPRCTSDRELRADRVLLHSLKRRGDPRPPEERLRQGLDQAVVRGTLLRIYLKLMSEGKEEAEVIGWYFFNTPRSRKVVAGLQGGEMIPVRLLTTEGGQENSPIVPAQEGTHTRSLDREHDNLRDVQVQIERPNIFVLYEQNIGLLSPLIADELKDAADQYPAEWIEAAFREAVQQNKRNWKYIRAILRRWETEGRQAWKA